MIRRRLRPTSPGKGLRVGLFGVLGSGNWGNDGSLEVVISYLRDRLPDARLGFMAMGPDCLEARYGAPAVHLQWYEAHMDRLAWVPATLLKVVGRLLDPLRTLAWVRKYDVVIVPGAGVFETTTPTRPWGMPFGLLLLGVAARLCRTRVAYVSVGANPTRKGPTQWVLAWAARLAHYRSYRDELSRDALHQMGVDVLADRIYPDLVFAMDVPPVRATGGRCVGVGVMNYHGGNEDRPRAAAVHDAYVRAMKRFVALLVDEDWQVVLFTGDKEDDTVLHEILESTRSRVPHAEASVSVARVTSLQELMDVMTGVDFVVASRYHNVLSSLKLAIPTISVSYARKGDVLMESMGVGWFCQPAGKIEFETLVTQFRELSNRRQEIVETLAACNLANAEGVARQFDDLSAFLVGEPSEVPGQPQMSR